MKYINANLLREKIAEQMESLPREVGRSTGTLTSKGYGMMEAFQIMRSIIDSLQQEPLIHTELCTLIACDVIQATAKRAIEKPQDKDKEEDLMIKKMEYLNMLEKGFSTQKLPEVNLEEELNRYLRGEFKQTAGGNFNNYIQVARHFAEWGAMSKMSEVEDAIRLTWGKVSKNPFDTEEAFAELINKVKSL